MKEVTPPRPQDRLDRYAPSVLSAAAWAWAGPVVVPAIRDLPRSSDTLLSPMLAHICWLLARPSVWDQTSPPDLKTILTPEVIDQATSAEGWPGAPKSTRASYRQNLRRLGRSIGSVPERTSAPTPVAPRAQSTWLQVRDLGPLTAVAAAVQQRGWTLHAASWLRLGEEMAAGGDLSCLRADLGSGSAARTEAGTVADVRLVAGACAAASEVEPSSEVIPANRTEHQTPQPVKRLSRSAAIRQARAAQATKAAARAATTEPPAPLTVPEVAVPETELYPKVEEAIATYRMLKAPAGKWAPVAEAVRQGMRAYGAPSASWVSTQGGHVARFALWVADRPERTVDGELRVAELADMALVAAYIAGPLADVPDSTRATARSVLTRMVHRLRPDTAPERIGYTPIQAPYTPSECARFVRLARNQPTKDRRRALSALVALGLGAGLDGHDLREIAPAHVREVPLSKDRSVLVVTVPGGQRPRTVVMRDAYADLLREAIDLHHSAKRGKNTPLTGNKATRANVGSAVTDKAVTATGPGVDISTTRLRSTWLLACMCAPIPLNVLLCTAGLRSARSLADLLPHCPAPSDADVQRILAAIPDAPAVAS